MHACMRAQSEILGAQQQLQHHPAAPGGCMRPERCEDALQALLAGNPRVSTGALTGALGSGFQGFR
jgi:hypothetical protein